MKYKFVMVALDKRNTSKSHCQCVKDRTAVVMSSYECKHFLKVGVIRNITNFDSLSRLYPRLQLNEYSSMNTSMYTLNLRK